MHRPHCCLLLSLFLILLLNQPLHAQKQHHLHIGAGIQSSAERDRGFSPLMYTGAELYGSLAYQRESSRKSDLLILDFATGQLSNTWGTTRQVYTARILTYTFYHQEKEASKVLHWGWSNNNELSIRDNETMTNYNGRSDYFTSFGPAMRFRLPFELFNCNFTFQTLANVQLLGFTVLPSFVSSSPIGFDNGNSSGFKAFWESLGVFYPGNSLNGGCQAGLSYEMKSANLLAINYNYDYLKLKGFHTVEKSKGTWMVSLIVRL